MTDFFDDIDLGGSVVGVIHVPPERILGDTPDAPIRKVEPAHTSRNRVNVFSWKGEPDYVLTLTVGVKVTRKDLSFAIQEWRIAHPRIDKVRVYVQGSPLMNLPIFTLHHCGFVRTGIELCWERDMKLPAPKPAPVAKPVEPKEERFDSWGEELASLRSLQEACRKDRVIFKQPQLDRIALLESMIAEQEAWRTSPEMKELDTQIAAAKKAYDTYIAELQKGKS